MSVSTGFYHRIIALMYRKMIVGLVAFAFLFSGTEIHQLLRLSPLLGHLNEHRQKDASMDIWKFLQLHYTANHPDDNDDREDEELPFKSTAGINHLDILFSVSSYQASISCPLVLIKFDICDTQFFPSGIAPGVFRPPCFAERTVMYQP